MPIVELRREMGVSNSENITLTIQDQTYDYLMTSTTEEVRVSAYFDKDWAQVEAMYEEFFVSQECPSRFKILKMIPGSRTRHPVVLPGPMKDGEQLTIQVERVFA